MVWLISCGFVRSAISRHPSRSCLVERMSQSQRCAKSSKVCSPSLLPPTFSHLSFTVNSDLMAENHTLRGLLRSLSAFIGEGAGGVLPKLGWSLNDFEDYVNRGETDTAWESFQKHKGDRQNTQAEASTSQQPTASRKRTADEASSNRNKRPRSATADVEHACDMPVLGNSVPADGATFNDLLRANASASPMFMTPQSATSQTAYPSSASGSVPFTSAGSGSTPSFLHGLGLELPTNNASDSVSLSLPPPRANQTTTTVTESPEDNESYDPKLEEAGKLITYVQRLTFRTQGLTLHERYHLDNYKRVNTYCLPASLRPTLLQRFVIVFRALLGQRHSDQTE